MFRGILDRSRSKQSVKRIAIKKIQCLQDSKHCDYDALLLCYYVEQRYFVTLLSFFFVSLLLCDTLFLCYFVTAYGTQCLWNLENCDEDAQSSGGKLLLRSRTVVETKENRKIFASHLLRQKKIGKECQNLCKKNPYITSCLAEDNYEQFTYKCSECANIYINKYG